MAAVLPGDGGWIVSTSLDKPDVKTRRLIRSHVMRGKNTREDRRLRRRKKEDKDTEASDTSSESPSKTSEWSLTSPRKVASEISTFGFGLDMQPYMEELVYRAYTLIKPSALSLEQVLVGQKQDDLFCFANLSRSDAMLHSVLFSTQTFRDMALNLPPSDVARWHEAQTLSHLQRMLSDQHQALAPPTMAIVASLATAAVFGGDFERAAKHIDGLWRMVELKGGFDAVGRGSMIEHKAQRLDFGLSLTTGKKVRFLPEKESWAPAIAFDNARRFPELGMISPRLEPKLLNAWADVRQFALEANEATSTNRKLPRGHMRILAHSLPWRLTDLEYDIEHDSILELIRLSLLALIKSVLTTVRGMGPAMHYMTSRLQTTLLAQSLQSADDGMHRFMIWACLIASVAIFEDLPQNWLYDIIITSTTALNLPTWSQTRAVLKEHKLPWIDVIYDDPCEVGVTLRVPFEPEDEPHIAVLSHFEISYAASCESECGWLQIGLQ